MKKLNHYSKETGSHAAHQLYLIIFIFDHILGHFKGAKVFVHALELSILCGILVPVKQTVNCVVIVMDHTAVILLVVP